MRLRRGARLPREVVGRVAGRVLAWAPTADGWLVGTRSHLVIVPAAPADLRSIGWEQIESADWDDDAGRLVVREVGEYGQPRPAYTFAMEDAGQLLQLVRERIMASIVIERRVNVRGKAGFSVIGRRSPGGDEVVWMTEYDDGVDPDDPEVAPLADAALDAAREELGDSI